MSGQLKNKLIIQTRNWLDPDLQPIPPFDYDYIYPITVFEAVKRNMEENSSNLLDELTSIYRLINDKQNTVEAGVPGNLMTWTGSIGGIGSTEVTRSINPNPENRSHSKIPTERAVGHQLDTRATITQLNTHTNNRQIHITDVERTRWNQGAPLSTLQAHIANAGMHVTNEERQRWNNKAEQSILDEHMYNTNNPHNVTAHQAGTYTRREIDDLFEALRESFFNYVNIQWNNQNNTAELVRYHPANWNPNYVLAYDHPLPDVPDQNFVYFALKPASNYIDNETNDAIIYIKRPGLVWQEVGFASMRAGDMVVKFPETHMYVWVQGRFMRIFANNVGEEFGCGGGSINGGWKPIIVDQNGNPDFEGAYVTWEFTQDLDPPPMTRIRGLDGYTPVKGVDYVDGKDGEGVEVGGMPFDILVKLSEENFHTTWKSLPQLLSDLAETGWGIPENLVFWDRISDRPLWLHEPGDSDKGFMTQKSTTDELMKRDAEINKILDTIHGPGGLEAAKKDLYDHLNDFDDPHKIRDNLSRIGAVSITAFNDHVSNINNPHAVTKDQVGLGNADNTSDENKPVSIPVQKALDELKAAFDIIFDRVGGLKYFVDCSWDNNIGRLIFTFNDKKTLEITIPIIDVFKSLRYESKDKSLVITLPDGNDHFINIEELIQVYFGHKGSHINVIVENDNVIKADIIPASISELEIMPSVHLRGSPTTLTQPVGDRSTRIATTEYVKSIVINNLISFEVDRPLSANMGRILNQRKADIDEVINIIMDLQGVHVIDTLESTSPTAALSANMGRHLDTIKAPRVHTSPQGSTFGRATVELFGHVRASNVDPLMDGTVSRGTDNGYFAREDHIHPTDITRAPVHSPHLTGEPHTTTPPDDSNDTRIVNTEWIRRNIVSIVKCYSDTLGTTAIKVARVVTDNTINPLLLKQSGTAIAVTFRHTDISNVNNDTELRLQGDSVSHKILYGDRPLRSHMISERQTYLLVFSKVDYLGNPDPLGRWVIINPSEPEIYHRNNVVFNVISPFMGTTIEGSSGANNSIYTTTFHGEVDRVIFVIPFKTTKITIPDVQVSEENGHWTALMGDNSHIALTNPQVIFKTNSHAVVRFNMARRYPSNSACFLTFNHVNARIAVIENYNPPPHIPVSSITGIPSSIIVGNEIALNPTISPGNATVQTVDWSIVSGINRAEIISNSIFKANNVGEVRLRGTVIGGGNSLTANFATGPNPDNDPRILITAGPITINNQPVAQLNINHGHVSAMPENQRSLLVEASIHAQSSLTYKWFRNTVNSINGATEISGAINRRYNIPDNISLGTHFYFCEVSATTPGTAMVRTQISRVSVDVVANNIIINPKPSSAKFGEVVNFNAIISPGNAVDTTAIWSTNNPSRGVINSAGILTVQDGNPGPLIVTARTQRLGVEDSVHLNIHS